MGASCVDPWPAVVPFVALLAVAVPLLVAGALPCLVLVVAALALAFVALLVVGVLAPYLVPVVAALPYPVPVAGVQALASLPPVVAALVLASAGHRHGRTCPSCGRGIAAAAGQPTLGHLLDRHRVELATRSGRIPIDRGSCSSANRTAQRAQRQQRPRG